MQHSSANCRVFHFSKYRLSYLKIWQQFNFLHQQFLSYSQPWFSVFSKSIWPVLQFTQQALNKLISTPLLCSFIWLILIQYMPSSKAILSNYKQLPQISLEICSYKWVSYIYPIPFAIIGHSETCQWLPWLSITQVIVQVETGIVRIPVPYLQKYSLTSE